MEQAETDPDYKYEVTEDRSVNERQRHVCDKHGNKTMTVFCFDHQTVCCNICVRENHKECPSLDTLENIGRILQKSGTVDQVYKGLEEIYEGVTRVVKYHGHNIETLQRKKTEMINIVKKDTSKLIGRLEAMALCFEEDLNDKVIKQIECIQNQQQEIQTLKDQMQKLLKDLHYVRAIGENAQIASEIAKMRTKVAHYQRDMNDILLNDNFSKVDLEFDETSLKILFKSLPLLKVNLRESVYPANLRDIFESVKALSDSGFSEQRLDISVTSDIADIEAMQQNPVNILSSDEIIGTWITGGASLANGRMIICDFNNQKLKTLGNSGTIETEYGLNSCPWDLTCTSDEEVLVCFTNEVSRYRYSVGLRKTGSIHIPGIQGIAVLEGRIFAILSQKLLILSEDGNVIKSIKRDSGNYVPTVATSKSLQRFYYMDGLTKLVCRDINGKELWKYDSESLSSSAGIGVDLGGNVHVCCVENGKVHMISRDGSRSRSFIDDFHLIKKPWKIWFDELGDKCFVSEYGEAAVVEVYRLKEKQRRFDVSCIELEED